MEFWACCSRSAVRRTTSMGPARTKSRSSAVRRSRGPMIPRGRVRRRDPDRAPARHPPGRSPRVRRPGRRRRGRSLPDREGPARHHDIHQRLELPLGDYDGRARLSRASVSPASRSASRWSRSGAREPPPVPPPRHAHQPRRQEAVGAALVVERCTGATMASSGATTASGRDDHRPRAQVARLGRDDVHQGRAAAAGAALESGSSARSTRSPTWSRSRRVVGGTRDRTPACHRSRSASRSCPTARSARRPSASSRRRGAGPTRGRVHSRSARSRPRTSSSSTTAAGDRRCAAPR